MNEKQTIRVKGARVHNLKNIDVEIPRHQLVVLTGLSGSGKSSLAFDTIYAEGQRRYVESLSSYARQFLQMQDKPEVDLIEGLSPAISIEQKTTSKNPRSTVATVTEIYDYLRLLYARAGKVYCYSCDKPIDGRSASQIVDLIATAKDGTRLSILSPIVRDRKGEYRKLLETMLGEGFLRARIDGEDRMLDEDIELDRRKKHSIEIYIDRVIVKKEGRPRIADAVELALKKSDGLVRIVWHSENGEQKEELLSNTHACIDCGISYPELEPRMFSFNAPQGACSDCSGLGKIQYFEEKRVIPDDTLSLSEGAIAPWRGMWSGYYDQMLQSLCEQTGISMEKKWARLSKKHRAILLHGSDEEFHFEYETANEENVYSYTRTYEGVIPNLDRRFKETSSDKVRWDLEKYMVSSQCRTCDGARLRREARHVRVGDKSIHELVQLSISDALASVRSLDLGVRASVIAKPILLEIDNRLAFLDSVGLSYLTLDRSAGSLSGGEAQRIRLASQIGSALVGVLYVLDEPSIGLHQRDNARLLKTLQHLRDLGNTVLVVEHDEETILTADHIIDIGPGAGHEGGEVVAAGAVEKIKKTKRSLTGDYLARRKTVEIPEERRAGHGVDLKLKGACGNNLQTVDVAFPLGKLVCVTGVSGSGKSSLVLDTLHRALDQALYDSRARPLPFDRIEGLEKIDKVVEINQSPIGRTPRSNPVTYTGVFDDIRKLFAQVPESQVRGFGPGRFSFNVKGGRCESCQGDGLIKIEMNFLPDVYVTCEECKGKRYNPETLLIAYRGKSISDILAMNVSQARAFFSAIPAIHRKLKTLEEVGLGYIHLGQPATTLSGGEAQRVKLSRELSKRATGKTMYILDEPTTGLHFHDVKQLLSVLHRFADQGNTVVVIEHNLDVIKTADWIIDMGPEGGSFGGQVVVAGTPEDVARKKSSHTGRFLSQLLKREGYSRKSRPASKPMAPDRLSAVRGRKARAKRIQKASRT
jgi:excinuclease ABC subunit A